MDWFTLRKTRLKAAGFAGVLAGALLGSGPAVAWSCPGCGAALDNLVGRGFDLSIVFMIAMPFAVVGFLALAIAMVVRKSQPRRRKVA